MKKNYFKIVAVIGVLFLTIQANAQQNNVGIGTNKPDESALLDLSSETKGFLTPRMTLSQRGTIKSPANGLMIYQTDFLSGFYFFDGKEWRSLSNITSSNSTTGTDGDWTIIGNAGTTPSTNFIGTTDNNALVFKVNGRRAGYLGNNTNTYLGYLAAETSPLGISNNTALGTFAFASGSGNDNTAIGQGTLRPNTGEANVALGNFALANNTGGNYNMAIGSQALIGNTTGNGNVAIGTSAFNSTNGSNGTAIGFLAGYNKSGSGSVYIGSSAGQAASLTSESNVLYIANSSTSTPLIGGNFSNNNLKFHLGTSAPTPTTGYLAIGDFATAAGTTGGAGGLGIPAMATASDKYRLIVQDGILTERLKVALRNSTEWADYVFDKSYKLMPLEKVEAFVKANKHLPNVPSAEEMAATGIDMQKTSTKFMEKIEELTLYMIEMNKEIKALKVEYEQYEW